MLSRQKSDLSIRNHSTAGDQTKEKSFGNGKCITKLRNTYKGYGRKAEGLGHLEDLIANGRLFLNRFLTTMWEVHRIYEPLEKYKRRFFVTAVMNQHVKYYAVNFENI
jgi:hypothetical protein